MFKMMEQKYQASVAASVTSLTLKTDLRQGWSKYVQDKPLSSMSEAQNDFGYIEQNKILHRIEISG
jgi:hypothetical protein